MGSFLERSSAAPISVFKDPRWPLPRMASGCLGPEVLFQQSWGRGRVGESHSILSLVGRGMSHPCGWLRFVFCGCFWGTWPRCRSPWRSGLWNVCLPSSPAVLFQLWVQGLGAPSPGPISSQGVFRFTIEWECLRAAKNSVLSYVWEDAGIWVHCNDFFYLHLSCQEPVFLPRFSHLVSLGAPWRERLKSEGPSWVPLGLTSSHWRAAVTDASDTFDTDRAGNCPSLRCIYIIYVHVDYEESWAPKNWCFWTVVLEKTLESPLACKEIQPVHPKGDGSWVFIGRTDVEAETPILWPPHVKSWLISKDPYAGKDWGQEEKGTTEDEMDGWHHWLNGHEFE